jgi:predicted nuclease of predicted toxin-antitoxin system
MIWVDAHISPAIAKWVSIELGYPACSVRDLGLRNAKDKDIFTAARQAKVVVMTKDSDFVEMVERLGPPPSVIWLTCGNTGNAALRGLLKTTLARALDLVGKGEKLVEISGKTWLGRSNKP